MELQTIDKIFEKKIFRIPSYQRGYTWGNNKKIDLAGASPLKNITGQLRDLWNDLQNIEDNSWHYTGLLTLVKTRPQYDWLTTHEQFAIVDGQQRITTILILLTILIEKADILGFEYGYIPGSIKSQFLKITGPIDAYIFGYEADNPSDKFFKKHILKAETILDDTKESVYTENLQNARLFFEECISLYLRDETENGNSPIVSLKKLFDKVTTKLRFNIYILPTELNEYVVFETMNNRGKPLSELEKLKNRLMYLNDKLPLFNPNNTQYGADQIEVLLKAQHVDTITKIDTAWITIYQSLGANKSNPLSDEDFVQNHWIIYFDEYDRSGANVYSNFLFDTHFSIGNVYSGNITKATLEAYVKSLQESSMIWNKINNPAFFDSSEASFRNLILRLYRVGLKSSFLPVLMAILLKPNRDEYKEVIELLEDFSFKLFRISARNANTGDSKLYRLAYKIYRESISPQEAYAEVNQHIIWYYNFQFFKNQVIELFKTGDQFGYYKWAGIKYFLFEYDLWLRKSNNTMDRNSEIDWNEFNEKNSIEHIYPQSAAMSFDDYCDWYKKSERTESRKVYDDIQDSWQDFHTVDEDFRWAYCNSLGNLLALRSGLNSSISNDKFAFKKDQGLKSKNHQNKGYKYDSMSARIVANEESWAPQSIIDRGMLMLDFLWEKLHPGQANPLTINDKYSLLGLDFLITVETT